MNLRATCPRCGTTGPVRHANLGRTVRCPRCACRFKLAPVAQCVPTLASPGEGDRTVMGIPRDNTPRGHRNGHSTAPPPLPPGRGARGWWPLVAVAVVTVGVVVALMVALRSGPKAEVFGVIEVGSTGVKGLVVRFFPSGGGFDWEEKFKKDKNINLGPLIAGDLPSFRPETVRELQATLRDYLDQMQRQGGVTRERLFVVFSSGLFVGFKDNERARATGREVLAKAVQEAIDRPAEFVDVQDEVRYGLLACVPPRDRSDAALLDIGGGNIKAGYLDDQDQFYWIEVKTGTKRFTEEIQKAVEQNGRPFATNASALLPERLTKPLRAALDARPGVARRRKVTMIGGMSWALAACTRPADRGLRVELTEADVHRFSALVEGSPAQLRSAVLARVADPTVAAEAAKELDKVLETFTPEQLAGGARLLQGLTAEMRLEGKELTFFRKGHLAWPMGYLLKANKIVP